MIEMLIQRGGSVFDISQLVGNIEWSTDIDNSQAGKLKFDYQEDDSVIPEEGDFLRFRFNNQNVFLGRFFSRKRNSKRVMQITACDLVFYLLKNKHTYALKAATSAQIFTQICQDLARDIPQLSHRVVNASSFNVPPKMHDNETLFDIIKDALDLTLINRREWFFIRDNFGILEHINIDDLQTDLVIGDQSMATDFEFESSISVDTYNQVRLVRENQETMRREVYIVRDSSNIRKWGRIQFHDTVDDNLNIRQIEARAKLILEAKNRPTRKLKIPVLGDLRIRAGNGVVLNITSLRGEGFGEFQRALVATCTHKWSGSVHTMDLSMEVI